MPVLCQLAGHACTLADSHEHPCDPKKHPHSPSNSLIAINNPSGTGTATNPEDGITAVSLPGGALSQLFQEPDNSNPEPRYDAGTDIVADPNRPGSYYVLTLNDGQSTRLVV